MSTLPLLFELHADELLLATEPARWDQAAALLDTLARRAEAEGARLCFRVRRWLVDGDNSGFLMGLLHRGHELGWHCHGEDPSTLVQAMRQRGLPVTVATPGLVQAKGRRLELMQKAQSLGVLRLSDRVEQRWHAYQGWLPYQPIPGLWSFDTSIHPFEWGVLKKTTFGVAHAHGDLQWETLGTHIDCFRRFTPVSGIPGFFAAAVHDHNFCPPDSLRPLPDALDAFSRFMAKYGQNFVRTEDVPVPPLSVPSPQTSQTIHENYQRLSQSIGRLTKIMINKALPPRMESLKIGQRSIRYRVWGVPKRGSLLVVHGGVSGLSQGLGFVGLSPDVIGELGLAVYVFERSESTFRTPGNPVHLGDTRALLQRALRDGPCGILSWSGGLVPAARLASEQKLAFLIDAEGPVDRFSLVHPNASAHELEGLALGDDSLWADKEALPYLSKIKCRYVRLQAEQDHVHGQMEVHAQRAIAATGGRLMRFPGRLNAHGGAVLDLLRTLLITS